MSTSAERELRLLTDGAAATIDLATRIGRTLAGGEVLAITGPLGAGKTTFVKGLAAALRIEPRDVTSPTFLLVHEHEGRLRLVHVDAYRVGDASELIEIGVEERIGGGCVVAIEWADRVPALLPDERLDVDLAHIGVDRREIRLRAVGARHALILTTLAGERGTP